MLEEGVRLQTFIGADDIRKADCRRDGENIKRLVERLAQACRTVLGAGIPLQNFGHGNVVDYLIAKSEKDRVSQLQGLVDYAASYFPLGDQQRFVEAPAYQNLLGRPSGSKLESAERVVEAVSGIAGAKGGGDRDKLHAIKESPATALTLMFRPLFALFGLSLVIAIISIWHGQYAAFAPNLLIMGVVPVAVSWGIYRFVDRYLPNHLFIYVFLNAFFGAALAIAAVGLASTGFAAFSGVYPMHYLLAEYLPYYLLMAWAEAFTTGMVVTMMVVYKPEWVATFDDKRYLEGK